MDAKLKLTPSTFAKTLNKTFGKDWRTWTPETLYLEVKDALGIRLNPRDWEMVLALRAFMSTDKFWTDATAFENMVLAVNKVDVVPTAIQLCTPEEMAYAVKELRKLRKAPVEWSRDVLGYIKTTCRVDGLIVMPAELKFAEDKVLAGQVAGRIRPTLVESHGEVELDCLSVQQNKLYFINEYVKAMEASA